MRNYFDEDTIILPESMQDGILYSYILLKLYLKSLKHGERTARTYFSYIKSTQSVRSVYSFP